MMPPQNDVPSLDDIWAANCQVLFFVNVRRTNPVQPDKLWPTARVRSLWPEKSKAADLVTYLDKHYGANLGRANNRFYVHQGILTPDKDYVLRHVAGSLRHLANKAGAVFLNWLREEERQAGPLGVNITLLDFAVTDFPDYVSTVLELNHKTWPGNGQ
ncbi:unnamed protein product [Echinostoma caproni]|uniref:Uncharacterized protein n=1 Tax=Echinostoma caproni TaxID=27848 RepID=A0A183B013_9TREM|nr:unnamed protein product [Echinostoma caproni]